MIDKESDQGKSLLNTGISDTSSLPRLGEIIGNCRITSILGEGGIGIVYKGFEVDIEMERAIKVLKPGADEILRKQFEVEAKVTARLDHPNIIKVHGGGIWDGRLPFIQMEYIDGKSLRAILNEYPSLPPAVCLSIISVIASALDYAYGKSFSIWGNSSEKLVHLDLKPENLLLTGDGILKVMDFGLAQLGEERYRLDYGTPYYMSPEQHDQQKVDCRSDIYTLGIILYEMLCGVRPFKGELESMISSKMSGEMTPISELAGGLPEKVYKIVDKCLMFDKENRYDTHESLRRDIDSALSEIAFLSPQELIRRFMDNPDDFDATICIPTINLPQHPVHRYIPVSLAVIALIAVGYFAFRFFHSPESKQDESAALIGKMSDSATVSVIDSIEPPLKEVSQKTKAAIPAIKTSLPSVNQEQPRSVLQEAIDAFKEKNYTAVIVSINSTGLDNLTGATRDSAVVLLADAFYHARYIREIIELSSKYDVNDVRFYSDVSLAYELAPDFSTAAHYMEKAILAPSIIWRQPRAEILLRRAQFYKRRFEALQDETSRASMIEAYSRFLNEGCQRPGKECNEAKAFLEALRS